MKYWRTWGWRRCLQKHDVLLPLLYSNEGGGEGGGSGGGEGVHQIAPHSLPAIRIGVRQNQPPAIVTSIAGGRGLILRLDPQPRTSKPPDPPSAASWAGDSEASSLDLPLAGGEAAGLTATGR